MIPGVFFFWEVLYTIGLSICVLKDDTWHIMKGLGVAGKGKRNLTLNLRHLGKKRKSKKAQK